MGHSLVLKQLRLDLLDDLRDGWGRDGTVGKLRTEEQKLRTSLHGKFPGDQPQAFEAATPVEALGLFVILDDETGPRMVSKACFQN